MTDPTSPVAAPAAVQGPPHFRSVLLAFDPKASPASGVEAVWNAVRSFGAKVLICYVVMRPTSSPGNELDGSPADEEETNIVRELRARAIAELGEPGRDAPIKILHGDPGQRICEFAEYADCDLIVLGPRAKESIAKALKGSVSKYVVGNARRSVLVVAG
jgi:nucleotide-binding universal stress UspA family protein